ncbi:hypothetical protein [Mycobacterium intracellulare]|uniref:hypothetical protein n=1 Tax=Mycobacterium intracellulare TaxID=1767 RepID=UPI001916708A|nr:hypothetical protein [Mycobacterium intracellulare]BCO71429.1 hypothetical protein MINTM008_07640 [Mycobacterium intracellulare]BCO76980.1 hypothetical protein MINTM009_07620 [Mycobacterium intracellulare]BCP40670.1 hypothetical protein MINTMi27_07630 [Mycobacterium intracellulare]
MTTGTVYRPAGRNEDGDPVDADGNVVRDDTASIGTIDGLIVGGSSAVSRTSVYNLPSLRGDVSYEQAMIGFPSTSPIQLRANDIVQIDGLRLQCAGPVLFGPTHSITGRATRYSWISASSN